MSIFVPIHTNGSCCQDPGQPGAAEGPGEEVEARHVDALQEEHRVGVEQDRPQAEIVNLVNRSQQNFLVNIKPEDK